MKKILIGLMVTVLLMFGTAQAQEPVPPVDNLQIVGIDGWDFQGDMVYILDLGKFGVGTGMTLAKYRFIEARAAFIHVVEEENMNLIGLGVGANIKEVVESLGGEWVVAHLMPTVGVMGMVDFNATTDVHYGLYMTVIQLEF